MTLDRTFVARILPFAVFIALDAVLNGISERLEWDPRWWYALRASAAAALLAWFWREYSELGSPTGVSLNAWMLAVATGLAVFVLWINLDFNPLAYTGQWHFW
jgi:hypothetical protein